MSEIAVEDATTRAATLTEGLTTLLARPVDYLVRARAAAHLADWIGCAAAGRVEPAGAPFAGHGHGAAGPCRVLGGARVEPALAAFVNGAFGNVLEMDDVHRTAILHPGPVVIPAALAAAETQGAGGQALLDAIVRGYEAVIRVGRSVGPTHYRHWHKTATCGPFGAAAAAASILGLDAGATAAALGLAGTQSSGPWQCRLEGAGAKQLHTAAAARAGLDAARLAALGLDGPRAILEGPLGLYAATCPDADPDAVLADPDEARWLIEETSFKPWPACRHAHPAIDAARALAGALDVRAIDAVTVETYADALRYCDAPRPATPLAAKFSLQHAVAVTLAHGAPGLEAFAADAIDAPPQAALRARTGLRLAPDLDGAYPERYGARVRVELAGGEVRVVEIRDALGDPANPLDDGALEAKAHMLMRAGGLALETRDAVLVAARALVDGGSVAALTDLLVPR